MGALQQMLTGRSYRRKVDIVISANTQNYVLNTAKIAGYAAGINDVTLTINSGIVVGSSSTSTPALDIDTSWNVRDTLTVVVSSGAYIVGRGGNGARVTGSGSNWNSYPEVAGDPGGPALRAQRAVSINNAGTIGGGGGGGGGGGANNPAVSDGVAGGGGGGAGNDPGYRNPGGPYGAYNATGVNQGTLTTGGTGNTAGDGGKGGDGGGLGATGGTGASGNWHGGYPGGAGGNCTTAGSNANITWVATGTRLGTIA